MLGAALPPGWHESIPAAFARVAADTPDRIALVGPDQTLTYGQLARAAHRVARFLVEGAGPSASVRRAPPVAVVGGPAPATTVAMLGALEAGRPVAPLDPRLSPAALAATSARLGGPLIAIEPATRDALIAAGAASVVTLDDAMHASDDQLAPIDPAEPVDAIDPAGPAGPAVIYFTSGTTGAPKGAVFDHRVTRAGASTIALRPDDRVALLMPPAFAAAHVPMFATLLAGATGSCFDLSQAPVTDLAAWLVADATTVMGMAPSILRAVADALAATGTTAPLVRHIFVGGEPVTGAELAVARNVLPNAVLNNTYGLSETGALSHLLIAPDEPLPAGPLPAGDVLAWHQVDIVDEEGHAVAPGAEGEVQVTSPVLPLGYWGDPELTAARYHLEPDGRRSLRTGDRGRFRADGRLEIVGRIDRQVKVRGQSVDPARVEHALASLDGVDAAAVTATTGARGLVLVAHVVPAADAEVTPARLRAQLASHVAPHELPAAFALVESLPRSSSGKLDRAALREAAAQVASASTPYVAPRTHDEERVAATFADVLGVEPVGALDEFFQLGGDSLSALALQARVAQDFGLEVSLSTLLASPTVEALAASLESAAGAAAAMPQDPLLVALTTTGTGAPVFVVPGGGGNAFQLRPLALALNDRPTSVFLPRGVERAALPDVTVRASARRYRDTLVARADPSRTILAGYSYGGLVAHELAATLAAEGRPPALLVLLDPSPTGSRTDDYRARRARARVGADATSASARIRLEAAVAKTSARQALLVPRVALGRYDPERRGDVMYQLSRRQARYHRPRSYGGPTLLVRSRRPPTGGDADDPRLVRLDDAGLLTGPVEVVELAGSHHDLMRPPLVTRVAAAIETAATRFT